jgi:hypothetical protein
MQTIKCLTLAKQPKRNNNKYFINKSHKRVCIYACKNLKTTANTYWLKLEVNGKQSNEHINPCIRKKYVTAIYEDIAQ